MASSIPFLTAVSTRHSHYNLLSKSPIPAARIISIVQHALTHAPSPFNVRSTRCIIFFGTHHTALWQHAYDTTALNTPDALAFLGPKIKGYQAGYATILFFDDASAFSALSPRFQALSKQFPEWEEHAAGMAQYIVWTALATEGLGCSLQHYQNVVGAYLREEYAVEETWRCKAQLVFGALGEGVYEEKEKMDLQEAVRVYE